MKKLACATLLLALVSCAKNLPQNPPPNLVTARFDPSAVPPVAPAPNDLATNPATGKLAVPIPPGASPADLDFVAYLDSLDGFPPDTPGSATFDGALDPASVTPDSVRVYEVAADNTITAVSGATVTYTTQTDLNAPGLVNITPAGGGWTPGHTYMIAIIGGQSGVRGASQQQVVGSSAWGLISSKNSLVTCQDLTSPSCKSVTTLIPSTLTDPAARIADQASKAVQLEALRRSYQPLFDQLDAAGFPRANVPLLFRFKIADAVGMDYQPALPVCPPRVPTPNDLGIDPTTKLVNAPVCPTYTDAQKEFTTDYLNTLNGFPTISTGNAAVVGGDLLPSSVNATNVQVIDLVAGAPVTDAVISYDSTVHQLVVAPPPAGWVKGDTIAVVVVGGANGVQGSNGTPVVASDVFALARSPDPLVDCADLTDPTCHSVVHVAPLSDAQAVQLEAVREALAPAIGAVTAGGVDVNDIAVAWTFTIVSQHEVNFNLDPTGANTIIPFPNILLYSQNPDGGVGNVNFPNPTNNPLVPGLNSQDGFSTTGPVVVANASAGGLLVATDTLTDGAKVDPTTLLPTTVGLLNLNPAGSQPQVKACINCVSSTLPDGGAPATAPDALQLVPQVPLEESTPYAGFVTTSVKSADGLAAIPNIQFVFLRMKAPLVDANGQSTVQGLPSTQAAALEPIRQSLAPLFDGLDAAGLPRAALAQAWTFPTISVLSDLKQLHFAAAGAAVPDSPLYVSDQTATLSGLLAAGGLPHAHIGKILFGKMTSLLGITAATGTFGPGLAGASPTFVTFTVTEPSGTPPANGWPVIIFGHGLTGHHNQMLAIADTFAAAGYASIATDVIWHGDRTSCVGAGGNVLGHPEIVTDNDVCAKPATEVCDENPAHAGIGGTYGRCVQADLYNADGSFNTGAATTDCSAPPAGTPGDLFCNPPASAVSGTGKGACITTTAGAKVCEGGDYARSIGNLLGPNASGWNILNLANIFASRDNFRQQAIDQGQLIRAIQETSGTSLNAQLTAAGAGTLDGTNINYTGQSLGGILGSLVTTSSPEIHRSVLNVVGGDPVGILFLSPSFAPAKDAFIAGLETSLGVGPGDPGFDTYIHFADWIMDPADPRNVATSFVTGTPADRAVLIQYIEDDQVVPNATTVELINSANRDPANPQASVHFFNNLDTSLIPPGSRHGFLLAPPAGGLPDGGVAPQAQQLTASAQTEAVGFISTGTLNP
jgi:hypothetical protein